MGTPLKFPANFPIHDNLELLHSDEALGRFISTPLLGKEDFDQNLFLELFCLTMERRRKGDIDFIPFTSQDEPTPLFAEYFLSSKDELPNVLTLWEKAEAESKRLKNQPVELREIGFYQIPKKISRLFSVSEASLSLMKNKELEVRATFQGAMDPATQANRTTFAVNGIWERWAFDGLAPNGSPWHFDPVAGVEGRFVSPFLDSDFLILGGAKLHFGDFGNLELTPRTGYSLRKLVTGEQRIPGFEMAASLGESHSADSYWQLAVILRQGLSLEEEPEEISGGIIFKWVQ